MEDKESQTQHHVSHSQASCPPATGMGAMGGRRGQQAGRAFGAVLPTPTHSTLISTSNVPESPHCLIPVLSHACTQTLKDFDFVPGVEVHTYNLSTWRHHQAHHKFKANLVWIDTSRLARAIVRPCLKGLQQKFRPCEPDLARAGSQKVKVDSLQGSSQ